MYFLGNKDNILLKMVTTNRIFEGITASRYVVYLESHVGVSLSSCHQYNEDWLSRFRSRLRHAGPSLRVIPFYRLGALI